MGEETLKTLLLIAALSIGSELSSEGATPPASIQSLNLITNGGLEQLDASSHFPRGWTSQGVEVANDPPAAPVAADLTQKACTLSREQPHSGRFCAVISRTGAEAEHFRWEQKNIPLQRGRIYRLRFWAKANRIGAEMAAVCFNATGPEGPAWPLKPILFDRPDSWQKFEVLLRAQVGFNPLDKTDLQFRLYQWNPGASDDHTAERLWIDDVSFEPMPPEELAIARILRWLLVPSQPQLRYADAELSLGDGVIAEDSGVELHRDGTKLDRVTSLEQVTRPSQFAWSGRGRRVYILKDAAQGQCELHFRPSPNLDGGAALNMPPPDGSRALQKGATNLARIPLELAEPGGVARQNWPVTQGMPLPRGAVAAASQIRVLNDIGVEVPAQVRATSYWEDDSIRWALLDFNINLGPGAKTNYFLEYGNSVHRAEVTEPIKMRHEAGLISVDAGPLKFSVSTNPFRLFERLETRDSQGLSAPTSLALKQDTGKLFTTDRIKPYAMLVEESGPLHAVIAVQGWNAGPDGERLCTYTTRIHAYRGQNFVRVFHSLVNRHEQNVMGKYKVAPEGFPKEPEQFKTIELPQQSIADASLLLPLAGVTNFEFAGVGNSPISGPANEGVVHRQDQRTSGVLKRAGATQPTAALPGSVTVRSDKIALTAAIYNYTNLFPKELRVTRNGVELGLLPFSEEQPHGILKGTARTSEILIALTPAEADEGPALARAFAQPVVFSTPDAYCRSESFMNDALVPANDRTVGTYDRIMAASVKGLQTPLGPELDDCGLLNYGDFPYLSYNRWVNLEYDVDLGLYLHFARTGDRSAYLFGQDCSRHFLDSDTGWYTGNFETHGVNYRHNFVHYDPKPPSGHTYTVGLMHYYLLTGDRRGLEASRYVADACFRVCYFAARVKGSAYGANEVVAVPRLQHINNRAYSDPARYALHTYQAVGESKYLEASLAIAGQVARFNPAWFGHDDMYFHYRWPIVLEDLSKITGGSNVNKLIVDCADWTMRVPYQRYGEFRAAQCYSGYPAADNNARMMFQTIYAHRLTGRREFVDWFLNMYDRAVEKNRHIPFQDPSGKGFGKFSDNPARALEELVPFRTVMVDVGPPRFELTPPGKGEWKIAVGNTSETPVDCALEIGPLPAGVKMETTRNFRLALKQEQEFAFPIELTDALAEGRTTIPYSISTTGNDGRKGERHGFFAVHALRLATNGPARLLLHLTLDKRSIETLPAKHHPLVENANYIKGKIGQAIGPEAVAASFDVSDSIRAEAGTFALWVRLPDVKKNLELVRLGGHGYWFIAMGSRSMTFDAQEHPFTLLAPTSDRWHHLAITWDLRKVAFYVDGKPLDISRAVDSPRPSDGRGAKGEGDSSIPRTHFDIPAGRLQLMTQDAVAFDDVRIYSQPLSPTEIQALCKDLKFGQPPPEKLSRKAKRAEAAISE